MPAEYAEALTWLPWVLVAGGIALVAANWIGRAGPRIGWSGVWTVLAGAAITWAPTPGLAGAALAALAVVIAVLWLPRRRGGWKPSLAKRAYRPWDHEAELLRLCHGDKAQVERLIRYEIERNPKLSRAGAALSAAARIRHETR